MANWVCNKCTARMPVGSRQCPEPSCRAQDAHEEGGNTAVNVFEYPPEATAMEGFIAGQTAKAEHEAMHAGLDRELHATAAQFETQIAAAVEEHSRPPEDDPVSQRLGLAPGDPGARDSSADPEPVEGELGKTYELESDGGDITEVNSKDDEETTDDAVSS